MVRSDMRLARSSLQARLKSSGRSGHAGIRKSKLQASGKRTKSTACSYAWVYSLQST